MSLQILKRKQTEDHDASQDKEQQFNAHRGASELIESP